MNGGRNVLRLLIDTNIVIDFLTQRKPFAEKSTQVIKSCIDGKFLGFIAPHSIVNIFYILRKDYSQSDLRRMLLNLCKVFEVPEINGHSMVDALENSSFSDFEDCVQSGCADEANADYIITRNARDFAASKIAALTPEEFLEV